MFTGSYHYSFDRLSFVCICNKHKSSKFIAVEKNYQDFSLKKVENKPV